MLQVKRSIKHPLDLDAAIMEEVASKGPVATTAHVSVDLRTTCAAQSHAHSHTYDSILSLFLTLSLSISVSPTRDLQPLHHTLTHRHSLANTQLQGGRHCLQGVWDQDAGVGAADWVWPEGRHQVLDRGTQPPHQHEPRTRAHRRSHHNTPVSVEAACVLSKIIRHRDCLLALLKALHDRLDECPRAQAVPHIEILTPSATHTPVHNSNPTGVAILETMERS